MPDREPSTGSTYTEEDEYIHIYTLLPRMLMMFTDQGKYLCITQKVGREPPLQLSS